MKRRSLVALGLALAGLVTACGDPDLGSTSTTSSSTATTSSDGGAGATSSSTAGSGGDGSGGAGGSAATTGSGGSTAATLDELLDGLRSDPDATFLAQSNEGGWPAPVAGGYLFVTTDPDLDKVAGDHDNWAGTALTQDQGFRWIVLAVMAGDHYKFTNLTDFRADPWSRSYTYDDFGEMSLVAPVTAHLDRYFKVGDAKMEPRPLHILVPEAAPTHVLYAHDGQNLFDPEAFYGGWKIQDTAPPAMLVVGIDNTPARIDEYTHVPDVIDAGGAIGGLGDDYADFLQGTVRPLIVKHYGEPPLVGTMGSSLGGLIAFHIADHLPGELAFAASLSGTMGWGSIGNGIHNQTMIERYAAHGHQGTALYLDSGGDGGPCGDSDDDGVDDDLDAGDNYCETAQLRDVLLSNGYVEGADLEYVFAPGAQHNEAEWAARVSVPMKMFADL